MAKVCKQEKNEAHFVQICPVELRWVYPPINACSGAHSEIRVKCRFFQKKSVGPANTLFSASREPIPGPEVLIDLWGSRLKIK